MNGGIEMKNNIIINCPECYSRRYHIVAQKRGFSFDKAATGAIIGGMLGGHGIGLAAFMGIDGKIKKTYLQCDICNHVWSVK